MKIISTIENCETDELELIVEEDVSANFDGTRYERRRLLFSNVVKYVINEGPVFGCPIVVNSIIDFGVTKGGESNKITLETNAGEREIYFGCFSG